MPDMGASRNVTVNETGVRINLGVLASLMQCLLHGTALLGEISIKHTKLGLFPNVLADHP